MDITMEIESPLSWDTTPKTPKHPKTIVICSYNML